MKQSDFLRELLGVFKHKSVYEKVEPVKPRRVITRYHDTVQKKELCVGDSVKVGGYRYIYLQSLGYLE